MLSKKTTLMKNLQSFDEFVNEAANFRTYSLKFDYMENNMMMQDLLVDTDLNGTKYKIAIDQLTTKWDQSIRNIAMIEDRTEITKMQKDYDWAHKNFIPGESLGAKGIGNKSSEIILHADPTVFIGWIPGYEMYIADTYEFQ